MPRKAFTVAEANELIPALEAVLRQIAGRMDQIQRDAESLQVLDLLWGPKVLIEGNPDYTEARDYRLRVSTLMGEIEELVAREVLARGLRFPQGGLERGLIDFPSTWEGRWIYLCWHLGESSIQAWHETDGGFAGRQALTPEQALAMGLEDVAGWTDGDGDAV